MTDSVILFLWGVAAAASLGSALFFLRFWRETRDRFFFSFSLAFVLLGLNWVASAFIPRTEEHNAYYYAPRLLAFLLILWAIVDKNRSRT